MARSSLDARVQQEFDRFAAEQADCKAAFERLRNAFREYIPIRGCAPEMVRRVQQCVAEGRPASFIRLCDGEGNLLALGMNSYLALTEYCAREVSTWHFGSPDVVLEGRAELHRDLHEAIRNAEVIGFPRVCAMSNALEAARTEGRSVNVRAISGLGAVHAYLERFADELGLARKVGAFWGFSRHMLSHYGSLIEGRDIGLVSCHGQLQAGLRDRMGARSVDFYQVPNQARPGFGLPGSDDNTGHYPARYRELVEELRGVRTGIVYFVAAGMLGKSYCEAIRAAGGIALDIGAVADIWAGLRSRTGVASETVDTWRVL